MHYITFMCSYTHRSVSQLLFSLQLFTHFAERAVSNLANKKAIITRLYSGFPNLIKLKCRLLPIEAAGCPNAYIHLLRSDRDQPHQPFLSHEWYGTCPFRFRVPYATACSLIKWLREKSLSDIRRFYFIALLGLRERYFIL